MDPTAQEQADLKAIEEACLAYFAETDALEYERDKILFEYATALDKKKTEELQTSVSHSNEL